MDQITRKKQIALTLFEGILRLHEQDVGAVPVGGAMPQQQQQPATTPEQPVETPPAANTGSGEIPTLDDMIERLNVIRGGKSFSDPEVYGSLTTFFKGMNDADKRAFGSILMEIGKIVINADNSQQTDSQQQPAQSPQSGGPPQGTPPAGGSPGGMQQAPGQQQGGGVPGL